VRSSTSQVLEHLEAFYGKPEPGWPTDPYLFLIWWHCGYPASDAACERGWESLKRTVGVEPRQLLTAPMAALTNALTQGGMVPELRATRLKQIAARVEEEFGGDLSRGLFGPVQAVRRALKKFPNIADPGADRILLFAGIEPIAAVPSNCPHVVVRIQRGLERESYGVTYKEAQKGNLRRNRCDHRRAKAGILAAETAWSRSLQADPTKMRQVPGKLSFCISFGQSSRASETGLRLRRHTRRRQH
jgi:endonuclease III